MTVVNYISLDVVTREVEAQGRTAKVGAKVLTRRVVVIVLVLVLVLGVVRGGRRPVGRAGRVTRPSHSAAKIRICNTQQPLPTSHPFSCRCPTNDCSHRHPRSEPPFALSAHSTGGGTNEGRLRGTEQSRTMVPSLSIQPPRRHFNACYPSESRRCVLIVLPEDTLPSLAISSRIR